jgi:hypothetical protein
MYRCSHENCGREQRIWLPKKIIISDNKKTASSNNYSDVSLHHWCILCGCIENISDDRGKNIGYWINILSKIAKEFLITQSQKRLIVNELSNYECFDDLYCITGSAQREGFVKVIKKYSGLSENIINSYIY